MMDGMAREQGAVTDARRGPLNDVVVLEIGQALAGPFGAQLLADLGARVIKIEKLSGDDARTMPPHMVGGTSAYFLSVNRGKQSIAVDLKTQEGVSLVRELAGKADVLLANSRPGSLDALGLTYESLREANPRLVYCLVSGFGQHGPYRSLPAYDLIVQALSGGMSLTGEPGGRPLKAGIAIADMSAGFAAALGCVAALHEARRTGEGRVVDVSMLDVQVAMLSYQLTFHLVCGQVPGPMGNEHISMPELGSYVCRDGKSIVVAPMAESMWARLRDVLEDPVLSQERFSTRAQRAESRAEVREALQRVLLQEESTYWLQRLQAAGIPSAPINTLDMVAQDPQVQARGLVIEHVYNGQQVQLVGSPLHLVGQAPSADPPPRLGEHTLMLLEEFLGKSDECIQELIARRIVAALPAQS